MKDVDHVSTGKNLKSPQIWEESVFQATEVNRSAVTTLLRDLFEFAPEDSKHLVKGLQQIQVSVVKAISCLNFVLRRARRPSQTKETRRLTSRI